MSPAAGSDNPRLTLRERLQGLMVFRVLLVTLFLGGTIALDARTFASLSDPRNAALLSLIVLTYLLTIGYAVLLDRLEQLSGLAQFQIAADFLLTSILVLFTNGIDSVFVFLFYLIIVNTAIVVGRMSALYTAGATSIVMFLMGTLVYAQPSLTLLSLDPRPPAVPPVFFEVGINSVAAFLIAFLAGQLSERLGRTTVALQQKRVDLAQLRALTQNILASLNSGLLTVDEEGHIIYFNEAASSITGLAADEVYGRPVSEVFPEIAETIEVIDLDSVDAPLESTPPEPADPRFECHYERPDGASVYLGFSRSILRNSKGDSVGHIIVFQDLTEIRRLELEKQRSQRLAAVGELAASIAHEIRNPLASISGSVEMLQQMGDISDEDGALMEIVLREVDRLDSLISEFLQYSRPTELSFEPTDLRELIDDVLELFDKQHADGALRVNFEAPSGEGSWRAEIDKESLRQVLWNLLNNASDILEPNDQPEADIRVGLDRQVEAEQKFYEIAVEDRGPGVDEEVLDRIFEPFFTTKEDGSGLGLATSYRLVEEHDGQLSVSSESSLGGARFVIRLPASSAKRSAKLELDESTEKLSETSTPEPSAPLDRTGTQ